MGLITLDKIQSELRKTSTLELPCTQRYDIFSKKTPINEDLKVYDPMDTEKDGKMSFIKLVDVGKVRVSSFVCFLLYAMKII